MKYAENRKSLISTALEMERLSLNSGTAGNLSVRVEEGYLITPSGVPYSECQPEHIVLMSLEGKVLEDQVNRSDSSPPPSSEWRFHKDIYVARPEAGAVLHAHSSWCTTLACLQRDMPAFHYMIAVAGGDTIRCAPYATFGTQVLSDYALEALEDRLACLLGHHGLLCLHHDLQGVLALAVEVEHLAQVYCQTLQIGEPKMIDPDEMRLIIKKFQTYGLRKAD